MVQQLWKHEQEQVKLGLTLANTFTYDQHVLDHVLSSSKTESVCMFSYNASADVAVFDTCLSCLVCSFGAQHSGTSWAEEELMFNMEEVGSPRDGPSNGVLRVEWLPRFQCK